MISRDNLKLLLHNQDVAKFPNQKVLLCLGLDKNQPKQINQIREIASSLGVNTGRWNISSMLNRSKVRALRTDKGWELSPTGINWLNDILTKVPAINPVVPLAKSLREQVDRITNSDTKAFVLEAIECYERRLNRAAVVLSWQGALGLIYDEVVSKHYQ